MKSFVAFLALLQLASFARAEARTTQPLPRYNADPQRSVLPNGNFSKLDAGRPSQWNGAEAFDTEQARIDKDNGQVLQLASEVFDEQIVVTSTVMLKSEWKLFSVAARVRGFDLKKSRTTDDAGARVRFVLLDAAGKPLQHVDLMPITEGGYRDWSKPTQTLARDEASASLRVEITLANCAGSFEIDDVLVVPIDPAIELDADQIEAFQSAIGKNDADTVRKLVAADKRYLECRSLSYDGGTPLILTAWKNKPEMTSLLIELGADTNATDRNWAAPAIGWAAFWGRPKVTQILLDAGADANSTNGSGATALVSAEFGLKGRTSGDATETERREVIKLLVDHGGTRTKPKATK